MMRLIALCALLAGCGGATAAGGRGRGGDAVIRLDCPVADAALWIDDGYVGEMADLRGGVALPAGAHRLEIRHDHYHSRYIELTVRAGERTTVRVTLAPILP